MRNFPIIFFIKKTMIKKEKKLKQHKKGERVWGKKEEREGK